MTPEEFEAADFTGGNARTKIVSVGYGANQMELVFQFSEALGDDGTIQIPNSYIGSNISGNTITGNTVVRTHNDGTGYQACTIDAT